MANITSTRSSNPGSVQAGSHIRRSMSIGWNDIVALSSVADNDTATFTIPVNAGEAVETVSVKLITAFDDSGSGDELDVEVGDGSDANGFVTAASLHTDQTEITYVSNTGLYFIGEAGTTDPVNATNHKLYTTNDTIDILVTPNISTGTDYNLNELTAGEFKVVVTMVNFN